jgi:rRNA large subunit m3Psi methyltransferase RlmH
MKKNIDGGDYGIHFPWISLLFLIIGIASEITDALLLVDVLSPILSGLGSAMVYLISFITGSVCFFSMAAIGYQSANEKVEYKTKYVELVIWGAVGCYLVWLRINSAVFDFENWNTFFSDKDVVMGGLTILLYLGTGFMTYSSTKQLTDRKLYEYIMAKRQYDKLMNDMLDLKGESLTSVEFANKIEKIALSFDTITFVIGGSFGLSQEVKGMANLTLSVSKMTFPHQLFRVMLLEQIYRACTISNNIIYHK